MKIGEAITKVRKEHQLNQEQFAELFLVSRQTISNWENEKSYPDLGTIVAISDKFHISLDQLLKEDREMVKKIDGEKKKKRILLVLLPLIVLLALITIFVINRIYQQKEIQNAILDYTLERSDTYHLETEEQKDHFTVESGILNIYKEGYYDLSLLGEVDTGKLNVALRKIAGKEYYQMNSSKLEKQESLWLEKGDYAIDISVKDIQQNKLNITYKIHLNNQKDQ